MESQKFNHISALVGNTEIDLKPANGSAAIPNDKTARYIYGYFMNEQSGALNTLTLKVYDSNATLEEEIPIVLTPNQTIADGGKIPLLRIPHGRTLKAVSNANNILIILQYHDE